MATTNEITGDLMVSKSSESYRDNYDRIFRKKPLGCQHRYSRSIAQDYPRKCLICGETEFYKENK